MVLVRRDSGGTGIESAHVSGDHIALKLFREKMTRADWTTHDYNVHFSFGLVNDQADDREFSISMEGGSWDRLPDHSPLLYTAPAPDGPWTIANLRARTDLKTRYAIYAPLAAGETLYIANTLPRQLQPLNENFHAIAEQTGARHHVYGTSLEGRPLDAYQYGDPDRQPLLLVTSGFHPPEPDTFASEAIMEWLGADESRAIRDHFAVTVIPIANPDGYAHQTQGSNAAGVNMYWDFRAEDKTACPEAVALWEYCLAVAPVGYVDFHCYTFQLGKKPGPYQRPLAFYRSPSVRQAASDIYTRHAQEMGGKPVVGFSTYAPATLGSRLARKFDTLSLAKYHLHLSEGTDGCARRGLEVFRLLGETLADTAGGPSNAAHGVRPQDLVNHVRILWAGAIRPTIGLARRGRLREIDCTRFGLIEPAEGRWTQIADEET